MAKAAPKKGLNPDAKLSRDVFSPAKIAQAPTRNGYGEGLVEAGKKDPRVMVLCADLTESTRSLPFKQAYPDRFVQMGVSEQSMASIAAGMAMAGKIPFISSYAAFSPGRNWEQLRTTVALNNLPVKVGGAHAGVSVGPDGATHQPIEDIATMRVMPNMTVLVPADAIEARKATIAAAKIAGPAYIRFAREKSPVFTTDQTPFRVGKALALRFGTDATIIGAGPVLYEALLAAQTLAKDGLEVAVIDLHTLKPLDETAIAAAAKTTGAIVTVEEANILGGVGGAVCEALASTVPCPVERVGVRDHFGESGEPTQLFEAFGLTAPYIAMAVKRAVARKHGKGVPAVPEYAAAAEKRAEAMRKETMNAALKRVPKKWNAKKP